MVFRFPFLPRKKPPPIRSGPKGLRLYAIGDVHGCLTELERLLAAIELDLSRRPADAHLVFLGDLIDRGPASAGVIDRVTKKLPGAAATFLRGNHEEVMIACYEGDQDLCQKWLQYGGLQTLESYGLERAEIFAAVNSLPELIRKVVPGEHVEFLRKMQDYAIFGDFLFVHAGIRPGVPIDEQEQTDLRWIRRGFLDDDRDHGFMVVHGHTIVRDIEVHLNRIAVDTGCYETGTLTALVIEGSAYGKLVGSKTGLACL